MPDLDLADDTFVVADPAMMAALVADPRNWREWWPDLEPVVTADRGPEGIRWNVTGALAGSMEIWLEPFGDGVLVHYYLRVVSAPGVGRALSTRQLDRRRRDWKRRIHAVKDRLESGREPGRPRRPAEDVKELIDDAE